MSKFSFSMLFLLSLLFTAVGCSSGSDSEDVTESLEDRMLAALDFEGGSLNEADAPQSSDSEDAPRLSQLLMAEILWPGSGFSVELQSDFGNEADKIRARTLAKGLESDVEKAIVAVKGAKGHLEVGGVLSSGIMTLIGQLKNDPELSGHDFVLRFALQTRDGLTGAYLEHRVSVSDGEGPSAEETLAMIDINGAETKNAPAPSGSAEADAPQIVRLDAPAAIASEDHYTVKLFSDFTEEVTAAILTLPGSQSHLSIPGRLESGAFLISGGFLGRNLRVGDVLTFLWALQSASGKTGRYRTWVVEIVENPTGAADGDGEIDGDEDADPDMEPETDGDLEPEAEIEQDVEPETESDGDMEIPPDPENTWEDPAAGLEWQDALSPAVMAWDEAEDYCTGLAWAERDDWFLPTIDELRTLVRGCTETQPGGYCAVSTDCAELSCWAALDCLACSSSDTCYWDSELADACETAFWSATELSDDEYYAWVLSYRDAGLVNENKSSLRAVRCARHADITDGDTEGEIENEIEPEIDGDDEPDTEDELEPDAEPDAEETETHVAPILECGCETTDACCDGCLPVHDFQTCDDGNAQTVEDVCFNGACAGVLSNCSGETEIRTCTDGAAGTAFDYCTEDECLSTGAPCVAAMQCLDSAEHTDCCTKDQDCCGNAYCALDDGEEFGKCLPSLRLTGPRGNIKATVYSEDGRFLAMASDDFGTHEGVRVFVYEADSGRLLQSLMVAPYILHNLAFGRGMNAHLLATSSEGTAYADYFHGRIAVWNVLTGQLIHDQDVGQDRDGLRVVWSPSGNRLAEAFCASTGFTCYSGTVNVYSVADETLTPLSNFAFSTASTGAMEFLDDDHLLFGYASENNPTNGVAQIGIYDITQATPTQTATWHANDGDGVNPPTLTSLLPLNGTAGNVVFGTARDNRISVHDITAGTTTYPIDNGGYAVTAMAQNDSGTLLALSLADTYYRRVKVFNTSDWTERHELRYLPDFDNDGSPDTMRQAKSMAFRPGTDTLAIGTENEKLFLWDAMNGGDIIDCINSHSRAAMGIVVHPNGSLMISGGRDNRFLYWDLDRGIRLDGGPVVNFPTFHRDFAITPDGTWIVGHTTDAFQVFRVDDGWTYYDLPTDGISLDQVSVSPDGRFYASTQTGPSGPYHLDLWHLTEARHIRRIELGGQSHVPVFSPDGRNVATARNDVEIWNVSTGESVTRFSSGFPHVDDMAYLPDGQHLVATSDGYLKILDIGTGSEVASQSNTGADSHLAVSPDGSLVAIGFEFNSMWTYIYRTSELLAAGSVAIEPARSIKSLSGVFGLEFTPDGNRLVQHTGSGTEQTAAFGVYDVSDLLPSAFVPECDAHVDCSAGEFCNRYLHKCVASQCADGVDNDDDGRTDDADSDCEKGFLEVSAFQD